jgi:molecular chaperone DnaJ
MVLPAGRRTGPTPAAGETGEIVAAVPTDYYEILGVPRDASPDDIKRAYRSLARETHPDVNGSSPDAEERFKELGEAYAVLGDPDKRRRYDLHGSADASDFGFADGFPDIFEIFNQAFGFSGGRHAANFGRDLQYEVEIELEEVLTGAGRKIELTRQVHCETCHGSGAKPGSTPATCSTCQGAGRVRQVRQSLFGNMVSVGACPTCRGQGAIITEHCETCSGAGRVQQTETFTVEIPAGIESGQHLEYQGYGDVGEGGSVGSLYVRVTVADHDEFLREGPHVHALLPLAFWQAALGDRLTVRTLEGETQVTIKPGTQHGSQIRLGGKGLPQLRRRGRGDHIFTVQLTTPQDLTAEQREAFVELARAFGEEPPAGETDKGFFARVRETLTGE